MQYKITYTGKITSTNKTYGANTWKVRSSAKNKFSKIFSILLLEARIKPFNEFKVSIKYRSRHDVDNLSLFMKIFVDTLKGKYVPDDSSKHFTGMSIDFDKNLPQNTVEFYIDAN